MEGMSMADFLNILLGDAESTMGEAIVLSS